MKDEILDPALRCPFIGISLKEIEEQIDISVVTQWNETVAEKKTELKNKMKEINASICAGLISHKSGKLVSVTKSYSIISIFNARLKKRLKELEIIRNQSSANKHYYFIKTFYSVAKDMLEPEMFDKICNRSNEIVELKVNGDK